MARQPDTRRPGFGQEVLAVLGIFSSIFLYLSLVSHVLQPEGNWCGETGTLIAQVLFGFTGWGAYLIPTLVLLSSLLFFGAGMSFQRLP